MTKTIYTRIINKKITPVEGFERVAPDQKRMRCDKFTTFA